MARHQAASVALSERPAWGTNASTYEAAWALVLPEVDVALVVELHSEEHLVVITHPEGPGPLQAQAGPACPPRPTASYVECEERLRWSRKSRCRNK
jgi:hypothetical protein